MGGPARWSSLRLPRWLLPVVLVLGVWGMHTLGHLAAHHGRTAASGPYALAHAEPPAKTTHGGEMPERPTELIGPASPAEGPMLGAGISLWLDPTDVCLAVLPLVLSLLIALIWARTRPWPEGAAAGTPWVGAVARSPPRRLAPTLAGLSVMRT